MLISKNHSSYPSLTVARQLNASDKVNFYVNLYFYPHWPEMVFPVLDMDNVFDRNFHFVFEEGIEDSIWNHCGVLPNIKDNPEPVTDWLRENLLFRIRLSSDNRSIIATCYCDPFYYSECTVSI